MAWCFAWTMTVCRTTSASGPAKSKANRSRDRYSTSGGSNASFGLQPALSRARRTGVCAESRTPSSRRAAAHRRGVPRQRQARHLRQGVPVEPQNIDVAVDKVCNIEPAPIRAEGDALGESADIDLSHLADRLSVDLEQRHIRFLVSVEGGLGRAPGTVQYERGGIAPGRAHRQPFRAVADDHLIDDARRVRLHVDHPDRVDLTVLAAADVVDDRELAVGRYLDVERVEAGGHVVILAVDLGVADLLPVDIE